MSNFTSTMYATEKAKDYERALERVCGNVPQPVTTGEIYSFEYEMDSETINLLIVCDGVDAESIASDLGLRLLGRVAKAELYN